MRELFVIVGWVDVPWAQSTSAPLQKSNGNSNASVKVVDISRPDVQSTISEVEKKDSKDGKNSKPPKLMAKDCRGIRENVGRRIRNKDQDAGELENQSNLLRDSGREISGDLANLRLLMAVEDLLDNASSDLVASALAEAASLDQLRAASRNLQSSFCQGNFVEKKSTSSQGSRETSSQPNSLNATGSGDQQERQPLCEADQLKPVLQAMDDPGKCDVIESTLPAESSDSKDAKEESFLPTEAKRERSECNIYVDVSSSASVEFIGGSKSSETAPNLVEEGTEISGYEETEQKDRRTESETTLVVSSNSSVSMSEGFACEPSDPAAAPDADVAITEGVGKESPAIDSQGKQDANVEVKEEIASVSSQTDTEDKTGYVTEFFDARSDEFSESDKNRQNERGRELLPSDGDLLFSKSPEVILTFFASCKSVVPLFYVTMVPLMAPWRSL